MEDRGKDVGVGGQKVSPSSFSPVPSTNVGLTSKNPLTLIFSPFATLL